MTKLLALVSLVVSLGACDPIEPMIVPEVDAQPPASLECPNTVFATAGAGLCGVLHLEPGVAYPCVSTCTTVDGAPVAQGCRANARTRGPFDKGADGPDTIAGSVVCGCGDFCR